MGRGTYLRGVGARVALRVATVSGTQTCHVFYRSRHFGRKHHHGVSWGNPRLLLFVPGKLMATLAYRDDKSRQETCFRGHSFGLTSAEPFFRPDRSSTAPSCRVAVKEGRTFRGHLNGLSSTAASTTARWRYRSGRRQCVAVQHVRQRGDPRRFPGSPNCGLYRSQGTPTGTKKRPARRGQGPSQGVVDHIAGCQKESRFRWAV